MANRFLDAANGVGVASIDGHRDTIANDGDVESVPLTRPHKSLALSSRQAAEVAFFALQQNGLITLLRERSPARLCSQVDASVVSLGFQSLPFDMQHEVGIDVMRSQ